MEGMSVLRNDLKRVTENLNVPSKHLELSVIQETLDIVKQYDRLNTREVNRSLWKEISDKLWDHLQAGLSTFDQQLLCATVFYTVLSRTGKNNKKGYLNKVHEIVQNELSRKETGNTEQGKTALTVSLMHGIFQSVFLTTKNQELYTENYSIKLIDPLLKDMTKLLFVMAYDYSKFTYTVFKIMSSFEKICGHPAQLIIFNDIPPLVNVINHNWENPITGVRDLNKKIYCTLIKVINSVYDDQLIDRKRDICCKDYNTQKYVYLTEQHNRDLITFYWNKAKYLMYAENIKLNTSTGCFSNMKCRDAAVDSLSKPGLVAAGADMYYAVLERINTLDEWCNVFLQPILSVVNGQSEKAVQNWKDYWCSPTLKKFPDVLYKLLDNLGDVHENDQKLFSALCLLKQANKLGNITKNWSSTHEKGYEKYVLSALEHRNANIRMLAFEIVCVSPGKKIPTIEYDLVIDYIRYNINSDCTVLRINMLKSLESFLTRLHGAFLNDKEDEHNEQLFEFCTKYQELIVASLNMNGNYQRKITCLELVNIFMKNLGLIQRKRQDKPKKPGNNLVDNLAKNGKLVFREADFVKTLLSLTNDAADDVREKVISLLLNHYSAQVKETTVLNDMIIGALKSMSSMFFYQISCGHTKFKLITNILIQEKVTGGTFKSVEEVFDYGFQNLISEYEYNRGIVESIEKGKQLHSYISLLQTVLEVCLEKHYQIKISCDQIKQLLAVFKGVSNQFAWEDDTSSDFSRMNDMVQDLIKKSRTGIAADGDATKLSSLHQLVLNCLWLNVKASCELSSILVQSQVTDDDDVISEALQVIIRVLDTCRHKGAIEAAGVALGKAIRYLTSLPDSHPLSSLPLSLLQRKLQELTSANSSMASVTRRGAGLSIMLHRIVASDAKKDKPLFHHFAKTILDACKNTNLPENYTDTDVSLNDKVAEYNTDANVPTIDKRAEKDTDIDVPINDIGPQKNTDTDVLLNDKAAKNNTEANVPIVDKRTEKDTDSDVPINDKGAKNNADANVLIIEKGADNNTNIYVRIKDAETENNTDAKESIIDKGAENDMVSINYIEAEKNTDTNMLVNNTKMDKSVPLNDAATEKNKTEKETVNSTDVEKTTTNTDLEKDTVNNTGVEKGTVNNQGTEKETLTMALAQKDNVRSTYAEKEIVNNAEAEKNTADITVEDVNDLSNADKETINAGEEISNVNNAEENKDTANNTVAANNLTEEPNTENNTDEERNTENIAKIKVIVNNTELVKYTIYNKNAEKDTTNNTHAEKNSTNNVEEEKYSGNKTEAEKDIVNNATVENDLPFNKIETQKDTVNSKDTGKDTVYNRGSENDTINSTDAKTDTANNSYAEKEIVNNADLVKDAVSDAEAEKKVLSIAEAKKDLTVTNINTKRDTANNKDTEKDTISYRDVEKGSVNIADSVKEIVNNVEPKKDDVLNTKVENEIAHMSDTEKDTVNNAETEKDMPVAVYIHFLTRIVTDSSLTCEAMYYSADLAELAFGNLTSAHWQIRNAALQLYGALLPKLIGQKKPTADMEPVATVACDELRTHSPRLWKHMMHALNAPTPTDILKHHSNLVPILNVLANCARRYNFSHDLNKQKDEDLKLYNSLIQLLKSPIHTVRKLAAKAIYNTTDFKEVGKLVEFVNNHCDFRESENALNGCLMVIENYFMKNETYDPHALHHDIWGIILFFDIFYWYFEDKKVDEKVVGCWPMSYTNRLQFLKAFPLVQLYKLSPGSRDYLADVFSILDERMKFFYAPGVNAWAIKSLGLSVPFTPWNDIPKFIKKATDSEERLERYYKSNNKFMFVCFDEEEYLEIVLMKLMQSKDVPKKVLIEMTKVLLEFKGKFNSCATWKILYEISKRINPEDARNCADVVMTLFEDNIAEGHEVSYTERFVVLLAARVVPSTKNKSILKHLSTIIASWTDPKQDPDLRNVAALALNELGKQFKLLPGPIKASTIKSIVMLLQDEDADIRYASIDVYKTLTNKPAPHPYICLTKILHYDFLYTILTKTDIKKLCHEFSVMLDNMSQSKSKDAYNPFANDSNNIYLETSVLKKLVEEVRNFNSGK